jgi:hypothetical protein
MSLGHAFKPKLRSHEGKGATPGIARNRQAGVECFRFGEPFDRAGGAVNQSSPTDPRGGGVDRHDPFLKVIVRPLEFLGLPGSQTTE